ncbi:MAG: alanine dehydrogenase, partial [Saprospiraceae bacterium]|nr:alanine dehydrogenase [Saprospiraceae bacterium]
MRIGVPKEIKDQENRVSVTPAGVYEFKKRNHHVIVQSRAGVGSGFTDDEYVQAGAEVLPDI